MRKIIFTILLLFLAANYARAQNSSSATLTASGTSTSYSTASANCVALAQNTGSVVIQLSGTWSGTVSFYASTPSNPLVAITSVQNSISTSSQYSSYTANGAFQFNVGGFGKVCAIYTTATSPPVTTTISFSPASAKAGGGGIAAAVAFSGITSGTNTTAAMVAGPGSSLAVTGGTLTTSNLNTQILVDGTTYALSAAGINSAITAAGNGGTVVLPAGTITTTACINLASNLHLLGQGAGQSSVLTTAATIITNGASDIFCSPAATALTGDVLEGFKAVSTAGGGHIFNFTDSQAIVNNEIRNVELVQNNAAKAVIYDLSTGGSAGFYGNHVHDFNMYYAASSSVPAIDLVSTTINGDTFENFISSGTDASAGTWAIFIEQSANNPLYGLAIRNGTFEQPGGGGVHCGGCYDDVFQSLVSYDLTHVQVHPFLDINTSNAGTASHNNTIINDYSTTGSGTYPDLNLVDASSSETVINSTFAYLNTANFFTSVNSTLTHINNTYAVTYVKGVTPWIECQDKGLGDGLNAIPAGTYLQTTCQNLSGKTILISGVTCYTDNNGTSSLDAAGNTLGELLTGAITCSNSFAAGTQGSNVLLTSGDYIKFTFIADGTSKQTDWTVTGN